MTTLGTGRELLFVNNTFLVVLSVYEITLLTSNEVNSKAAPNMEFSQ